MLHYRPRRLLAFLFTYFTDATALQDQGASARASLGWYLHDTCPGSQAQGTPGSTADPPPDLHRVTHKGSHQHPGSAPSSHTFKF